jgi:predicted dehydrogenase
MLSALIVGLGSIGRRHLANLRLLVPDAFITVCHQHSRPADGPVCAGVADSEVFSLEAALETRPHVALITGPASGHVATARSLAAAGVHLLVEKPLAVSLDGVEPLIEQCRQRELVLLVGYNFRFAGSLQEVKRAVDDARVGRVLSVRAEVGQYLPDWRPGIDYRRSVSASSSLGGGALLELSHEIDYVRWLAGDISDVTALTGRLSDLDMDVEDTAEILLGFTSGAIGSIHLDMIQRAPVRTCRVIGSEGTLLWDGLTHEARHFSAATGMWTNLGPPASADRNEMYVAELRHFLACVRGDATPAVTGEDGRRVLQIALAARQSSLEGRRVTL